VVFIEVVLKGRDFNEAYFLQFADKIAKEIDKEVKFYSTQAHDNTGLMVFENVLE
jgi:hypothetical protein